MDIQQTQINTAELIDFIKWSFGIAGTSISALIGVIYFGLANGIKRLDKKFDSEVQPLKEKVAKLENSEEWTKKITDNIGKQHDIETLITLLKKAA